MTKILKKEANCDTRQMARNSKEIERLRAKGSKTREINYKGQPIQTIDASKEITLTMSSFDSGVGKSLLINHILSIPGVKLAEGTEFSAYVSSENGDLTENVTLSIFLPDILNYIGENQKSAA